MTPSPSGLARHPVAGLSLVELLAVMAVLAVTVAAVSPALVTLASTSRLDAAGAQMHTALRLARSEAIKRDALVAIEPTDPHGWAGALRVYADADGDPSSGMAPDDTLIRQFGRSRSVSQTGATPVRIAIDGRGRNVSLDVSPRPVETILELCTARATRQLRVEPSGMLTITTLSQGC